MRENGLMKRMGILWGVIALLNLLGCLRGFCDWYKRWIYGVVSDALGMATAWIPFALGEVLAYLGVIAVIGLLATGILLIFLRKRPGFRRFAAVYGKGMLVLLGILGLIYTLNWILPFRATILKVPGMEERKYTLEEVQEVRDYLVAQLNVCAKEAPRDENGQVIYDLKTQTEAVYASMKAMAGEYPLLGGYYPPMKKALCKDFLEWMDIGGYTYPYTMEVTYNPYVSHLFYPSLLAHESAHHQGYYQENEANFIAFLACTRSEDPVVRYAGYNEIYYYLNNALVQTAYEIMEPEEAKNYVKSLPKVSKRVQEDRENAAKERQARYDSVSHPAQNLAPTAAQVADVGWSVQGDMLKENSYDGVVKMVLDHYFQSKTLDQSL